MAIGRSAPLRAGDTVLVTGASSGLGQAVALLLAAHDLTVYASVRDAAGATRLEAAAAQLGVSVRIVSLDITDEASVSGAVERVLAESGAIAAVVNNAGIAMRGCFEDCDDQQVRELFETNVFGTMAVTRAVLPHMRSAGRGRVVIVTSVAGLLGSFGMSSYCASKFALEGFGESLAQELAPLGIHVSLVEPAIIRTPVWSSNMRYGRRSRSQDSAYARRFRAAETLASELVSSSPTEPEHVAEAVVNILRSERPRLRTIVGRRARTLFAVRKWVPAAVFDRQYLRAAAGLIDRSARKETV